MLMDRNPSLCLALNAASGVAPAYGQALAINATSGAPEWIELIPSGPDLVGRDGRRWRMSDVTKVVAAFAANRADLPIDWEHAQYLAAEQGKPAPAAGWIKQVEARNGALWGHVEWTERGGAAVSSKEYRYISPVFSFDAATREVTALKCAGLVNRPNLELQALNQEGTSPMWKQVLAALGLPETATEAEAEAVAAIKALQGEKDTAFNRANNPPLTSFVPRADYDAALNREKQEKEAFATFKRSLADKEIEAVVGDAVTKGQIVPATKDYHIAACRADGGLDAFKAMIAKVPVNDAAKASGLDGKKPDGAAAGALNADELAICRQVGVSEADFIKSRDSQRD